MTKLDPDGVVLLASGDWGDVVAVRTSGDACAVEAYVESLPVAARAKFISQVKMLAARGMLKDDTKFHQVQHPGKPLVWELKIHFGGGHRFYCIREGQAWVLTHGGPKPKRNALYSVEVKRCQDAFSEWKAKLSG